ncbi:MAG: type 1 glutamine amidotransferase domain-containing protein [Deltaproteobacteria bacterium]|nr:type 1 glutamine amidotransferase domain-containing protein [Deltaproteobacteria bacterium]
MKKISWKVNIIAVVLLAVFSSIGNAATSKKVLVVLSSENKITLKNGVQHPTGFFMSELIVPLRIFMKAGFEPVFATPKGKETRPVVDQISRVYWFDKEKKQKAPWFKSEKEFSEILAFCIDQGLCSHNSVEGTLIPKTLGEITKELSQFAGLFIPGGHAPMEDLWKDRNLGLILKNFHKNRKPVAAICHGPIALLAALDDPEGYIAAFEKNDEKLMAEKTKNWIYRDTLMTSFSTREEQQEEPGQDNVLGDFVKFYPDQALDGAGARVLVRAAKWQNNVVTSEGLVTGENPFSDETLGRKFLLLLESASKER